MGGVIKGLNHAGRLTEEEMLEVWREAAGDAASQHSRPVSFGKTTIVVNVDRSSWLYELTVNKKKILQKLDGKLKDKKIKDIRLRIGDIAGKKEKEQKHERE